MQHEQDDQLLSERKSNAARWKRVQSGVSFWKESTDWREELIKRDGYEKEEGTYGTYLEGQRHLGQSIPP